MSTQPADTAAESEPGSQGGQERSTRWVTVAKIVAALAVVGSLFAALHLHFEWEITSGSVVVLAALLAVVGGLVYGLGQKVGWKTLGKVIGILAALGIFIYLVRRYVGPYVDPFIEWVESLGVWAPIVFILGYIVATIALIPGSLLTAAGGALFGLLWGTIYVAIAATTGACLAFLIARYVARGWVEKKLEGQPRFTAIDKAIGREGGKVVALMRLSPVFPFNLLNYALGLTKVKFWHYALACLAMVPGTFLYVYYGAVGRAAAAGGEGRTIWDWVQLGVGLVATLAVTWFITKKAKKALDEQTDIDVDGVEANSEDGNNAEEEASDE